MDNMVQPIPGFQMGCQIGSANQKTSRIRSSSLWPLIDTNAADANAPGRYPIGPLALRWIFPALGFLAHLPVAGIICSETASNGQAVVAAVLATT